MSAADDWAALRNKRGGITRHSAVGGKPSAEQMAEELQQALLTKLHSTIPEEKLEAQKEFFTCPEWAGTPPKGIHFEIHKQGKMIDQVMIDKFPYYLLGRNPTACDIDFEHPSLSRVHLAVVHHQKGSIYVIDLNSAHGTFIKGERIKAKTLTKVSDGDEIRLGDSSRTLKVKETPPVVQDRKRKTMEEEQPKDVFCATERLEAAKAAEYEIEQRAAASRDAQPKKKADFWGVSSALKTRQQQQQQNSEKTPISSTPLEPIKVSHILKIADDDAAVQHAKEYLSGLKQTILLNIEGRGIGHSFAKAAKKHSDCSTALKKGLVGKIEPDSTVLPSEVTSVAFSTSPESISQPIVSELGVHLIYRH